MLAGLGTFMALQSSSTATAPSFVRRCVYSCARSGCAKVKVPLSFHAVFPSVFFTANSSTSFSSSLVKKSTCGCSFVFSSTSACAVS